MKSLHSLINDVDAHNQQLAANLWRRQPHLFTTKPAIAKGDASFNTTVNKSTLPNDYRGVVGAKQDDTDKLWKRTLKLDNLGTMTAVLSVIDNKINTNGAAELPVVLCVGVNYGQQGGSKNYSKGQKLCDNTGMRRNLQSALNLAGVKLSMEESHLVAANFCPWITLGSWQNVAANCLVSALLLRSFGYDDPSSEMASLIDLLQPSCLVFHGSGNSVPILALEALRKCKLKQPKALLCDNLGYPVWRNSVALL
jgi:hypothetical protein